MPLVTVSDNLKDILKRPEVKKLIKEGYITEKMFVDSAIRAKLRSLKVPGVGGDEIIPHLERLRISKAKHINQQKLSRKRRNHLRRMEKARRALDEIS